MSSRLQARRMAAHPDLVRELQEALRAVRYDPTSIEGLAGPDPVPPLALLGPWISGAYLRGTWETPDPELRPSIVLLPEDERILRILCRLHLAVTEPEAADVPLPEIPDLELPPCRAGVPEEPESPCGLKLGMTFAEVEHALYGSGLGGICETEKPGCTCPWCKLVDSVLCRCGHMWVAHGHDPEDDTTRCDDCGEACGLFSLGSWLGGPPLEPALPEAAPRARQRRRRRQRGRQGAST